MGPAFMLGGAAAGFAGAAPLAAAFLSPGGGGMGAGRAGGPPAPKTYPTRSQILHKVLELRAIQDCVEDMMKRHV